MFVLDATAYRYSRDLPINVICYLLFVAMLWYFLNSIKIGIGIQHIMLNPYKK